MQRILSGALAVSKSFIKMRLLMQSVVVGLLIGTFLFSGEKTGST